MNHSEQLKSGSKTSFPWSALRFSIGFYLVAIMYVLIARNVLAEKTIACSSISLERSVIEGTRFLPSILIGSAVSPESRFYDSAIDGVSSLPFAILGGFIISGSKKGILYTSIMLIIYVCLMTFAWAFFMAAICA
jgi:hypothetical protein